MVQAPDALELASIQSLKTNAEALAEQVNNPALAQLKRQFITQLLDKANAKLYWKFLFQTLSTELQLNFLQRLLGDRLPQKEDWVNLFRRTDYDFRTGTHYRIVLTLAGIASAIAIAQMVYLPLAAPNSGLSWIGILPAVITVDFWLFLRQGVEQRFESHIFRTFGLLGVPIFLVEISFLFRTGSVWIGVRSLLSALDNGRAVAVAVAVAGTFAVAFAFAGAFAGAGAVTGAGAFAGAGAVTVTVAFAFAVDVVVVVIVAFTIAGAFAGAGVSFWARAAEKDDIGKYLAILSFPFFCWFPITLIYATLALLNFFTWPIVALIWSVVFAVGTWCWVTGQKLDRQARNPLQGILPDHYNPNYKG